MSSFMFSNLLSGSPSTKQYDEWDIQLIPLDKIIPAKKNEYRICDIEQLSESILLCGLMQPLEVRKLPDSDLYEIINGERRYTALKKLNSDGIAGWDVAPCKVTYNVSDIMAMIKLIHGNSTTRILTDAEKVNGAMHLAFLYKELRKNGEKVPGGKRNFVAKNLKVSTAQVGRMESIDKNLIPEAKEKFTQGDINISAAYETSLLSPDKQKDVINRLNRGEKPHVNSVRDIRKSIPPEPETSPRQDFTESIIHELKTWPEYFEAILQDIKLFEYRKDDRNYQVGDILRLREYNPDSRKYTGRDIHAVVTYILKGDDKIHIPKGYVIMGIRKEDDTGWRPLLAGR